MDTLVDILLLAFIAICAIAILRLRDLFAATMMFGLFSLISAGLFTTMHAPDVAFTEAAVGAGISTILILATLAQTARREKSQAGRNVLVPLIVVWVTGAVLIYGTVDLPVFGDPAARGAQPRRALLHQRVAAADRHPEHGRLRARQLSRLRHPRRGRRGVRGRGRRHLAAGAQAPAGRRRVRAPRPEKHEVLKVVASMIVPVIMLFALYVQFHGEYSPGGGFQAGVIFAASIILYALVFGLEAARRIIPPRVLGWLPATGVLIFGGVGVLTMALGGNFLDYNVLGANPQTAQQRGIIMIEIGVGVTVASVMLLIYFIFAERNRGRRVDDGRTDEAGR
jgi:multicomponent Na+:H+ antiporter subunit B